MKLITSNLNNFIDLRDYILISKTVQITLTSIITSPKLVGNKVNVIPEKAIFHLN